MEFRRRIIPTLLLRGSGLYKGRKFSNYRYIGDPINTVRIFNDKQVDELILLDIDASHKKEFPNYSLLEEISSECFAPLTYGGGINSIDQAKKIISIGFEKIVVNTNSWVNPFFVNLLVDTFGSSSIIGSIDYKQDWFGKKNIYVKSARKKIRTNIMEKVKQFENQGVGEIIINCIDRDGEMNGYDIPLLKEIANIVSVPVIGLGGAGSYKHIQELFCSTNVSAAAAGSLFCFQGKHRAVLITYPSQIEHDQLTLPN